MKRYFFFAILVLVNSNKILKESLVNKKWFYVAMKWFYVTMKWFYVFYEPSKLLFDQFNNTRLFRQFYDKNVKDQIWRQKLFKISINT